MFSHSSIRRLFCLLFGTLVSVQLFASPASGQAVEQLKLREQKIKDTIRKVMPATVCVTDNIGFGSGVIVSEDGLVLTAGHVLVTEGKNLRLIFPDGREVKAKRLGKNLSADAGMAQITDPGPWPFVEMGKNSAVQRGDWAVCLGHSGGYVLGRQPPIRTGRVLNVNDRRIVTDCALIGGDSGGPLFNLDGKLIGIHSSIGTSIAENRHVTMDVFENDWERLLSGETWGKLAELSKARPNGPMLGVKLNKELDNQAQISRVSKNSPAEAAGLQAGDFITAIDDEVMIDWQHVIDTVSDHDVGDTIRLKVVRDGAMLELRATLRRRDQ